MIPHPLTQGPGSGNPISAMPHIVAMASGKGGTGTSTSATLLAAALAAGGRTVLLVDATDRLGTLDSMLGVTSRVPLDSLRGGQAEPADLIVRVSPGLSLIPAIGAHGTQAMAPAERRVLFGRVRSLFPAFDVVLLDAGSSVDSILPACASGATRVFAVTTADRIAVTATYALVKLLHEHHPDVRVDVLASRTTAAGAAQLHRALNEAALRFLSRTVYLAGVVPDDTQFSTAIAAGLGFHEAVEGSLAAQLMSDLGDSLFDLPDSSRPAAQPFTRQSGRN